MMSALANMSKFFDLLTPIILFVLVLTAILFLLYLKKKMDTFFEYNRCMARDIRRIADVLEIKGR